MSASRRFARRLRRGMLILFLAALTGCGTVYVGAGSEIRKVEGGWLLSDAALVELMECCQDCAD